MKFNHIVFNLKETEKLLSHVCVNGVTLGGLGKTQLLCQS